MKRHLLALAIAAGVTTPAQARDYNWVCGTDGGVARDWETGSCWTGDEFGLFGLPDLGDNVWVGTDYSNTSVYFMATTELGSAGTLIVDSPLRAGEPQYNAEVIMWGSSLLTNNQYIGYIGQGSFQQSGGLNYIFSNISPFEGQGNLVLGFLPGSEGTYELDGGVLSADTIIVGDQGAGHFDVTGGGLQADVISLARTGGSGDFLLRGTSGVIAPIQNVGVSGVGTFEQSGGTNTVDLLSLGILAASSGTYTLSGGTLNVGTILGGEGESKFNYDGGTLNWTGGSIQVDTFTVGSEEFSDAAFTLQAGKALVVDRSVVGLEGRGQFTQNGGIHIANTAVLVGNSQEDNSYHLAGGALLTPNLLLGGFGTGSFTQTGGSNFVSETLSIDGGSYYILSGGLLKVAGIGPGFTRGNFGYYGGTLDLTGSAIELDKFIVGKYEGDYTTSFTLQDGQSIDANFIALRNDSSFTQAGGTVNVTELSVGSLYTSGGFFDNSGTYSLNGGTLNVDIISSSGRNDRLNLNGGTLKLGEILDASYLSIGDAPGTTAQFSVSDGVTVNATHQVVGNLGTGSVMQTGGRNFASDLTLAAGAGSTGTYTLTGGTLYVGGLVDGLGDSTFNLNGGALNLSLSAHTIDHFSIGSGAGFSLTSSQTFTAKESLENRGTFANDGVVVVPDTGTFENFGTYSGSGQLRGDLTNRGILSGNGLITGDVVNYGTTAPGSSPGMLTIDGDYTQGDFATLSMELGGTDFGSFDTLSIGGTAFLDGTLDVIWYDGFTAELNDSFDLFDWGSGIEGAFDVVQLVDLRNLDWAWDWSDLYNTGIISIVYSQSYGQGSSGTDTGSSVPEPGTLIFIVFGLAGMIAMRRRSEASSAIC